MAYTVTYDKSVFGNKRVVGLNITADAATQTIGPFMAHIDYFTVGEQSLTTDIKIYANSSASGVKTEGVIGISGCTSGDQFYVVCFGR